MSRLESSRANAHAPPRLAGRYVVTRLLGKGAQARVYLGFDSRLKQWRAIKVLGANFLDDEIVRARFAQEAQLLASLSHPNLVAVNDVAEDGRTPFMVMELVRGGALTDWLKRNGVLRPSQACEVAMMACDGLEHAHSRGVVHRDVKPHNLLIRSDGTVCLTDFGIAQVNQGKASMTATGSVMGTFAYMAPEQRNDSKSVDGRADVYALGATLYTMLTLRTSAELFFAQERDEILAGVPHLLQDVILRACQYDPVDRYPDILAFRVDLEHTLAAMSTREAGPPLTDAVIVLPERPPDRVPPTAGVDDLRTALGGDTLDAPTMAKQGPKRLAQLLDEQPTTLYSDTDPPADGETSEGSAPLMVPYTMGAGGPRPFGRVAAPRAHSVEELSEEGLSPAMRQKSTMSPLGPRRASEVVVTAVGAQRVRRPDPDDERPGRSPWLMVGVSLMAACLLLLLGVGYGLGNKMLASRSVEQTSSHLINVVHSDAALVASLKEDHRVDIEDTFFAIEDAADRAEAAVAFVDHATAMAQGLPLDSVSKGQLIRIQQARDAYLDAQRWLDAASRSRISGLTGDLGL